VRGPAGRTGPGWSGRFLAHLESLGVTDGSVADRAAAGAVQVSALAITSGSVTAQVGSRRRPYDVWIDVPVFSPAEWARAERAMAADASCCAELLDGEVPDELEAVLAGVGLSLFPARRQDIALECSCPDGTVPCRHLTAVLRQLGQSLEADPFGILAWRGRSRSRLTEHLRDLEAATAQSAGPGSAAEPVASERPLAACLDDFWLIGTDASDGCDGSPSAQQRQPADWALLRLDPPGTVLRGRNLADLLRPVYEAITSW